MFVQAGKLEDIAEGGVIKDVAALDLARPDPELRIRTASGCPWRVVLFSRFERGRATT